MSMPITGGNTEKPSDACLQLDFDQIHRTDYCGVDEASYTPCKCAGETRGGVAAGA